MTNARLTSSDPHTQFSLNSDDPAYFGGYLLENYYQVHDSFNFDRTTWALICRNGIEGSWISEARKQELTSQLSRVTEEFATLP
jgi:adenosine deaminase